MGKQLRRKLTKRRQIESLEARQMMSGTPIEQHALMPIELHRRWRKFRRWCSTVRLRWSNTS